MNPLASPVNRVLVCGDWHGDVRAARAALHLADGRVDAVLHVGDLGILWPGESPRVFDEPLVDAVALAGVPFVFVDGNHDNHDALRSVQRDSSGFCEVLPGVWWAPRGHRWEWGGRVFGALGGAFSIDHQYREPGVSVWPGIEEVQPEDLDVLGRAQLDVLVCHDVPLSFDVTPMKTLSLEPAEELRADLSRRLIQRAVEATAPRVGFSGHWHSRQVQVLAPCVQWEVIDMNGRVGNALILDLADFSIVDAVDIAPRWHQWTRANERRAARGHHGARFQELVGTLMEEGIDEGAARRQAGEILGGEGE